MARVAAARRNESNSFGTLLMLAILTSVFTAGGSYLVQTYADEASRRDESRVDEVNKFIELTVQYRDLSSEFMRRLTQGQNTDSARENLLENVREQHAQVDVAKSNLSTKEFDIASAYQVELSRLVRLLSIDVNFQDSEPLVQELVDVLDGQVCVSFFLRREAGLSVSSRTEEMCATLDPPSPTR